MKNRIRYTRYARISFVAVDLFCINFALLALICVYYVKSDTTFLQTVFHTFKSHYKAVIYLNFAWLITGYFSSLYDMNRLTAKVKWLNIFSKQIILFSLVAIPLVSEFISTAITEFYLKSALIYVILCSLISFTLRQIVIKCIRYFRIKGGSHRNIIMIGYSPEIKALIKYFSLYKELGYNYKGFFSNIEENKNPQYNYLGEINEISSYLANNIIHEVYCNYKNFTDEELREIMYVVENNNVNIRLVAVNDAVITRDITMNFYDYIPVISFKPYPYEDAVLAYFKRIADFCLSLLFSIFILSWVIPLFAFLIKKGSKGPVFYFQERIGKFGKPFKIIKFRSMYTDAEHTGPKLSTGEEDDRITPLGKIMRKYRIDELPQFINVLKNDMSLVGPRPERQFFIDQILAETPRYKRLQNVKPGITSLGQVLFGYAENLDEMRQRARYDLLYLSNYSFWMDIKIIAMTVEVLIKGKGQ